MLGACTVKLTLFSNFAPEIGYLFFRVLLIANLSFKGPSQTKKTSFWECFLNFFGGEVEPGDEKLRKHQYLGKVKKMDKETSTDFLFLTLGLEFKNSDRVLDIRV